MHWLSGPKPAPRTANPTSTGGRSQIGAKKSRELLPKLAAVKRGTRAHLTGATQSRVHEQMKRNTRTIGRRTLSLLGHGKPRLPTHAKTVVAPRHFFRSYRPPHGRVTAADLPAPGWQSDGIELVAPAQRDQPPTSKDRPTAVHPLTSEGESTSLSTPGSLQGTSSRDEALRRMMEAPPASPLRPRRSRRHRLENPTGWPRRPRKMGAMIDAPCSSRSATTRMLPGWMNGMSPSATSQPEASADRDTPQARLCPIPR